MLAILLKGDILMGGREFSECVKETYYSFYCRPTVLERIVVGGENISFWIDCVSCLAAINLQISF